MPDRLWEIVEPLVPPQAERPQGGGSRYVDDRAVCTAIVDVLRAGCAWRHLPAQVGVSPATAHRRFTARTEVGGVAATAPGRVGSARSAGGDRLVPHGGGCGQRAGEGIADRADPGRPGKPGAQLPVLTDTAGLPRAVAVTAANTPDSLALTPLVQATPVIGSRRGPAGAA